MSHEMRTGPSAASEPERDHLARDFSVDFASTFAGVLLFVTAGFGILQGISAIANDDLYVAGSDYVYRLDITTWGWVHLVIGISAAIVAVGILLRVAWGQTIGIVIAGLSMLTNFAALPHYPWWSLTIIAFDAVVIWALTVQLRRYP
jgi:hypothetical protein